MRTTLLLCLLLLLPLTALAEEVLSEIPPLEEEIWDPLEPINRKIFWFNDKLDVYLFEPIATGYDFVIPDIAQTGVRNFFENLGSPIYMLSDLAQLKFDQFATHLGRMVINTTVGIGGLFDVASSTGLERHYEDMDVAFGYWGIPHGPYLVIPIIGPMTLRSGTGRIIDRLIYPPNYLMYSNNIEQRVENSVGYGLQFLEIIQFRADLLSAVEESKAASTDYYLFVQNTYYQVRRKHLYDGQVAEDTFEEELSEDDQELEESLNQELENEMLGK